ncbi:MAG: hypothetical protein HC906_05410 [Bacteroidales bacterium]|nr:hypothetical protein [Bacteroidales bacterium]
MINLKKNSIYLLILILITFSCDNYEIDHDQSESFIKYFGSPLNDYGCDVIQKADGGYIIAGVLSVRDSGTNICLIFTDKYGNSEHITSLEKYMTIGFQKCWFYPIVELLQLVQARKTLQEIKIFTL